MGSTQRWLLWISTALATVTGLVYAWMRYLIEGDDPFSAYNHPFQPLALHGHVLIVPVLLFAIGWFWGRHVVPKLRSETNARRSGITLIALIAVMTISGYGLQVSGSAIWTLVLAWSHGLSGTAFALLLAAHAFAGLRASATEPDRGVAVAGEAANSAPDRPELEPLEADPALTAVKGARGGGQLYPPPDPGRPARSCVPPAHPALPPGKTIS